MELTEIEYGTFATLINTYRSENLRKLETDVITEKNHELHTGENIQSGFKLDKSKKVNLRLCFRKIVIEIFRKEKIQKNHL